MKTALFILLSCISFSAISQKSGDTLIGRQYARDTLIPPLVQSSVQQAVAPIYQQVKTVDSIKVFNYTTGQWLKVPVKEFTATYSLAATDSLTVDYSIAGISTQLGKIISPMKPGDLLTYRLVQDVGNKVTFRVLRAVNTTVNLTGTTVAPFTEAGAQPLGSVSVWVKGY